MTYPHLPYAITEIYCLIFTVIMWFRLNSSMGSEHEVRQLRNMFISFACMLSTDFLWALMEDGLVYLPVLLNAAVNAASIIAVSCGCYFWFRYIEDRLHFTSARKKTLDLLTKVPLLLICAVDALSIFTGWIFIIDADGHYQETSLFLLQGVVNYFYLLIPTFYSACGAFRARSRQERSECRMYALYMIAPLASGILESVFPQVPLLALNIFLMLLILFLMIQNMQVYNDALTGLNNRRRLNGYLEDSIPKAGEHPILLFIMDINAFKSINDTYGHLVGDAALKTFAAILRKSASRYYAFAARYGGDEFCLVMGADGHSPEEVAADIRKTLQDAQAQAGELPYRLTVSIGYTTCSAEADKPDAVLARADKMLYEDKQKWHREND